MLVKCHFCEQKVEKSEAARYDNKNFHPHCLEEYKAKLELIDYICKTFGFKTGKPGPRIYSQIKLYREKNHYTYLGMKNSLIYFYEIKKNNLNDKNKETIGIIPYIYEEAQEYFSKLENKKALIKKELEKTKVIEPTKIYLKETASKVRNSKIVSLNNIFEEE